MVGKRKRRTDEGRFLAWLACIRDARDLSTNAKVVGLVLASRMHNRKASCYPAVALLAADTSLSVRSVQIATRELAEKGYLTIIPRERKSNLYVEEFPGRATVEHDDDDGGETIYFDGLSGKEHVIPARDEDDVSF